MFHPSMDEIVDAASRLSGRTIRTPVLELGSDRISHRFPKDSHVSLKLELFQQAGSFKARGALLGIDGLDADQRRAGVAAASGGNHALAVSWAAQAAGVSAKIFIPETADPIRRVGCEAFGAEVIVTRDIAEAFDKMHQAADHEGRTAMHPFEAPHMVLGAATCGLEYTTDRPEIDLFIVPVGGGGLISGMASAIKHANPNAEIIGVEPVGADSMFRSFAAGSPQKIDRVQTIADSLGSPTALPMTYNITRNTVSQIVTVEDEALKEGMRALYESTKIVAEPACAASLAALLGPLRSYAVGKKVGLIACGSNIGLEKYRELI